MKTGDRQGTLNWLALFTSSGTLVCCALPIILVSLGMGAAVASLTSSFPALITLSQHKGWVFAVSALLLAAASWLTYRPGRSCPVSPELARSCEHSQRWNRRILWIAIIIWSIGFFAAYLALPLQQILDGQ